MSKAKEKSKIKIQGLIEKASNLELELVWIPHIMENQLEEEKASRDTRYKNGVGLNKSDAGPITRGYNWINSGKHLSEGHAQDIRKRLKKYWKQYLHMMESSG